MYETSFNFPEPFRSLKKKIHYGTTKTVSRQPFEFELFLNLASRFHLFKHVPPRDQCAPLCSLVECRCWSS